MFLCELHQTLVCMLGLGTRPRYKQVHVHVHVGGRERVCIEASLLQMVTCASTCTRDYAADALMKFRTPLIRIPDPLQIQHLLLPLLPPSHPPRNLVDQELSVSRVMCTALHVRECSDSAVGSISTGSMYIVPECTITYVCTQYMFILYSPINDLIVDLIVDACTCTYSTVHVQYIYSTCTYTSHKYFNYPAVAQG